MPTRDQTTSPARLTRLAAALALAAGAACGVSCESTQTAGDTPRNYRPYESQKPTQAKSTTTREPNVNTGLASLSAERQPPALIETETPAPRAGGENERVAESARLLDEYFSRLNEQTGGAIAGAGTPSGYDPSAEIGPTGSSQYATASIDQGEIDIFAAPATSPTTTTSTGLNSYADEPAQTQIVDATPPSYDPVMETISGDVAPSTSTYQPEPRTAQASPSGAIKIEDVSATDAISRPLDDGTISKIRIVDHDPVVSQPATTPARPAQTPSNQQVAQSAPTRSMADDMLGDDPVLDAIESELRGQPVTEAAGATASAEPGFSGRVVTPEQRKQQLVDELVGLLQEIALTSDEPYRSGLALAGLETLSPGAMYSLTESGVLMPDEVRTLLAAHEMFSGLSAGGGATDAGRVSDLLAEVKEKMDEHAPLKIPAAELCTRVMGYGQYDMFPKSPDGSYTFRAGRRQPVIIYTEVDRFGRRPLVGDDGLPRWEVALSQELEIYHDADDLLVMARNAETDRSIARNKIRDYYLINQTYLPENLSVGRYNLKVIMRDANKQAVAESIIPFTIVAENPAIRGGS